MPKRRQHYEAVRNEILNLINKKDMFIKLYGNQQTVNLLNDIDGHCFGFIQKIYNDSIILSLTKLLDPIGDKSNKNLVLETLINDINDLDLKSELLEQLDSVRESSKIYKKHRNKIIAHSDYKTYFKEEKRYLAINDLELNQIIEHIVKIINEIEKVNQYLVYSYRIIYDVGTDCERLLRKLKIVNTKGKNNE